MHNTVTTTAATAQQFSNSSSNSSTAVSVYLAGDPVGLLGICGDDRKAAHALPVQAEVLVVRLK